jgi:hypothetical protein
MSAYDDLSELQRKFVEAYLVSGNAMDAYTTAVWCTKTLSARLWTISHPPATIHMKAYCSSRRGTHWL